MKHFSGITQYDPSEYTFTAGSGTPVRDLVDELALRGQALPFDPVLAGQGATIGGTIASGLSGSGRFRFGGVRDFLLGVQVITGDGECCVGGGKVVKNAAGFDIPKLLVGSLGRLGAISEVTMKVFPRAAVSKTILIQCRDHAHAAQRMQIAARSPWDLDAIDYRPIESAIYLRLTGPESSLGPMSRRIESEFGSDATEAVNTSRLWSHIGSLSWVPSAVAVARIPANDPMNLELQSHIDADPELHSHWSAAGGLIWVAAETAVATERLGEYCRKLRLAGLNVIGRGLPPIMGHYPIPPLLDRIAIAMDPTETFLSFRTATEGT